MSSNGVDNLFASFLSTIFGSLLSICVTALAAFAVTLIFRTSTTTNFAQGSIAAFGCYIVRGPAEEIWNARLDQACFPEWPPA